MDKIDEILDDLAESYYPVHEYNDTHPDENAALRAGAKAKLNAVILEEVLELVTTNQKGQFEDDAGHICWYLDDLTTALNNKYGKGEPNE